MKIILLKAIITENLTNIAHFHDINMPGAIIKKVELPFKNHINLMHIYLQVNNKLSAGDRRIGMKFHRLWQANRKSLSQVKFIKRGKGICPGAFHEQVRPTLLSFH